jgi:Tfp pilus assembly protein PilZ
MKGSDRFAGEELRAVCTCCGRELSVVNLSLGGLFVASDILPRVGEIVTLELILPDKSPVKLQGTVAWTNEGALRRAPELPEGYGIRLVQVDIMTKLALLNYLKQTDSHQVR